MPRFRFAALLLVLFPVVSLSAQTLGEHPVFSRLNSFGVFGEYSNTSGHILLGYARQRKLLSFGASYSRRILLTQRVDLQYLAEARPFLFESDPVVDATQTFTSTRTGTQSFQYSYRQVERCRSGVLFSGSGTDPGGGTYTSVTTATCGRRQWAFGQGLSPAGLKVNLLPHHALQPVFTALGGYVFSTQPIPVSDAGSFNFAFVIGAGVELYRWQQGSAGLFGNRSLRAEYRYHHISNKNTAPENPGIDSGLVQITYVFGR